MELIKKYFPELSNEQIRQFEMLSGLYKDWNDKINVISRKDIDNLYLHHILHSLAIAKYITFKPKSVILDLGTGGGFPGIPLSILFPEVYFLLVDSIGKKIKVVNEVSSAIGLKNVKSLHGRVEEIKTKKYDFIVTRAVASNWSRKLISTNHRNSIPNGIIALKGGNIKEEMKAIPKGEYYEIIPLSDYFGEEFFDEKVLVYFQG
jgi:16S rRNA (guanine527-N7)-methyltransferase